MDIASEIINMKLTQKVLVKTCEEALELLQKRRLPNDTEETAESKLLYHLITARQKQFNLYKKIKIRSMIRQKCLFCKLKFGSLQELKDHFRLHGSFDETSDKGGRLRYKFMHNLLFKKYSRLRRYNSIIQKSFRSDKCISCDVQFTSKSQLASHLQNHGDELEKNEIIKPSFRSSRSSPDDEKCPTCSRNK